MPLTSIITAYNPDWPEHYNEEARKLLPVFGTALIASHHVGSTAIRHLAAKPEIDILIVVRCTTNSGKWSKTLLEAGYLRGRDLSPGHFFFKRDVRGIRSHKVHVCDQQHPKVEEMLVFRNCLRSNGVWRDQYQQLKLELEEKNTQGIAEYLKAKEPFIRLVLDEAREKARLA